MPIQNTLRRLIPVGYFSKSMNYVISPSTWK